MKNEPRLLSRDDFRNGVFERDSHRCVLCGDPAQDAHHILERRLWPDGGYYLDNGASVCGPCHILCEETTVDVESVRAAAGIRRVIVPPHLYADTPYDKWGNPVLANGSRLRGELFDDASVQKILQQGGQMYRFVDWVKYPRTHHLPWSPGIHSDDRVIPTLANFEGRRVIVTEKMDGENTTMYSDYIHARSVDGRSHPSRDRVKALWSQFAHDIPPRWRVCGENLYAKHSIGYDNLPSYLMGFSIWNDKNICLSWNDTMEWFQLLGIEPVTVLYDGIFHEKAIAECWDGSNSANSEGYVVRVAEAFHYSEFKYSVAKYVRENHVQTIKHWMHGQRIEPNGLAHSR